MSINDNVKRILSELPENVILVAAVKYADVEQIKQLIKAGVTELGFNMYQQMEEVKGEIPEKVLGNVNFHFIGHLQRNKVRHVMKLGAILIQSLDSYKLATRISRIGEEEGIYQDVLVQVKTDPSKDYGVDPLKLEEFIRSVNEMGYITVRGLMTIPPLPEKPEDSRKYFSRVKGLFENASGWLGEPLDYLSMGMSDDYKVALEEGANMVRLGRVLYE